MDSFEMIDRLCAVVEQQAGIIREQAYLIENMRGVDDETKKYYAGRREDIGRELDLIEYRLRPYRNTGEPCGKE